MTDDYKIKIAELMETVHSYELKILESITKCNEIENQMSKVSEINKSLEETLSRTNTLLERSKFKIKDLETANSSLKLIIENEKEKLEPLQTKNKALVTSNITNRKNLQMMKKRNGKNFKLNMKN